MSFSSYKSMNLTNGQAGSADSTNWPLTIALDGNVQAADNDLRTIANGGYVSSSSGYDIRPYNGLISAGGTALTYELVFYDGATGKLELHVKIPTLNGSGTGTDTVIYLYFGDPTLTSDGSSNTTWNSNYKLVAHFPNGTLLTTNDSSQAANNLTGVNTPTAATGEIDGGVGLASASTQYLNTNGNIGISGSTARTISTWIKFTTISGIRTPWMWGANGNDTLCFLLCNVVSTNDIYAGFINDDYWTATNAVATGTWYHIAVVYDSGTSSTSTFRIYINGTSQSLTKGGSGSSPNTTDSVLRVGGDQFTAGRTVNGVMDEFRVMNTNVSQSWITADVNSQKASSTFIVWGPLVQLNRFLPLTGVGI